MGKWDELKLRARRRIESPGHPEIRLNAADLLELISAAEKAEPLPGCWRERPCLCEKCAPKPKTVIEEIREAIKECCSRVLIGPIDVALIEAVECIDGLDKGDGFDCGRVLLSILAILRGEKAREIPKA